MTEAHKLGKRPARSGAYSLSLTKYLDVLPGYVGIDKASLPIAPLVFGHQTLIPDFGMLGNDQYGDCVWAGAAHETMLWTAESGKSSKFSTQSVLRDYSSVTGFNPSVPSSDQGTDMEAAAKYRRKTGVVDAQGIRHTIDAYLSLPGVSTRGKNDSTRLLPALATSAYVFGAVGIGIQFPSSAMQQFDSGLPWEYITNASIEGGHYVPLIGRKDNGNFLVVTWGKLQEVTPEFLSAYVDEAIAYISLEQLANGKTLYGFDIAALRADLALLSGVTPVSPVSTDPNVQVLDAWANAHHIGTTLRAAQAWKAFKATHNL